MTFFDETVPTYLAMERTRNFRSRTRAFAKAAALAMERADDHPRAIDVGVGTGYLTRIYADMGFHVIGCDGSTEMLRVARRAVPSADIRHADALRFLVSLPTESADLVASSSVLEYLSDPLGVVRHAGRLLHTGGVLAVSLPQRDSLSRKVQRLFAGSVPAYVREWQNDLTGDVLEAEAREVGLRPLYRQLFGSFEWHGLRLPFERSPLIATLALYVFERRG